MAMNGLWEGRTLIDARVFKPHALLTSIASWYIGNTKMSAYDQRIYCEVDHSTFTPQVLSAMGPDKLQAISNPTSLKHGHPYGQSMNWLRFGSHY